MRDALTVLVVEHDQRTAIDLAHAFRLRGWDVTTAIDALMARSILVKSRPDAIVLNAQIPGGGLTALKRIRSTVSTANTPVIVLAADGALPSHQFLAAGAQEYLPARSEPSRIADGIVRHVADPPAAALAPDDVVQQPLRMNALKRSGLLDSPDEESYDQITRLIAKLLDVPTALLSLVDENRQFFKSQTGLGEPWRSRRETPLSHSFCQWVVSGQDAVVVENAAVHPVLKSNLAVRDLGVAAYAGVPVTGADGAVLGSLCAIDSKPRVWTDEDLETLRNLSKLAEAYVAQGEADRQRAMATPEFHRYLNAGMQAIKSGLAIMGRRANRLTDGERVLMLQIIEQYCQRLIELNRTQALHVMS